MVLTTYDVRFVAAIDVAAPVPANTLATRRFVLTDRGDWRFILYEDITGALKQLATMPGSKNGSASMVAEIGKLVIYITSRLDPASGDNVLVRHEVSVPGIWPADILALKRIQTIARVVSQCVPETAPELLFYTK